MDCSPWEVLCRFSLPGLATKPTGPFLSAETVKILKNVTTRTLIAGTRRTKSVARRLRTACATRLLPLLWLLALPVVAQAQFVCATNSDGVTLAITGYTGSGGALAIPTNINGLTVTSIGDYAVKECSSLTSVTIPGTVTAIGLAAFWNCGGLTNVLI